MFEDFDLSSGPDHKKRMAKQYTLLFSSLVFSFTVFAQNPSGESNTAPPANVSTVTPTTQTGVSELVPPAPAFVPRLEWSGDIRYRLYQQKEAEDDPRNHQQLRVRLGVKADVNEEVQAVFRLATGTGAISTNQTLGDKNAPGMPRRNFGLDLGYLDWKFIPSGRVWAGRTANPFWSPGKVQLIIDSDVAFEGAAVKWEPQFGPGQLFVNGLGAIISEQYSAPNDVVDIGLAGLQAGYSLKTAGLGTWTFHAATYHYLNIQDRNIKAVDAGASLDAYSNPFLVYRGNEVYRIDTGSTDNLYRHRYVLSEAGFEWKQKFDPVELTLFYDYVRNEEVSERNVGYETGILAKWGRLSLGYALISKEAESVLGAFTDGDANGGGTDNRGTRMSVGYQLGRNSQFALTDHRAKRGIDTTERDYSGTQVDFIVSF